MLFWTVYKVVFMPAIKNHSMMDLLKIHKKKKMPVSSCTIYFFFNRKVVYIVTYY